ncbi:hypothetical protein JB92DRAFT_2805139 [Gautieria morchelliformis]|nr:hypothetical protein JB92DRAFT_2805139 [Gautieria morchelliformis]
MSSQNRILVTGASGFIGSQIVEHLLQAGFVVRGTSRSNKAEQLRKNCPHPNFEVTAVDDLIGGDFSEALRDVNAVIHVASPIIGREADPGKVAIGGTMNIMQQAYKAKVFKITVLSSFAAVFTKPEDLADGSRVFTDKDWRQVSKEDVTPDAPAITTYAASKTLAERAAWEFAEAHPEIDLITLLPAYVYGPFAPSLVISNISSLSTNAEIYQLLSGASPDSSTQHAVDIRDIARSAVLSLSAKERKPGEKRRIILHSGTFTWKEAVRHIAKVRPGLKSRLADGGNVVVSEEDLKPAARFDTSKAKDVLGLPTFIDWKHTLEDTVDSILAREGSWAI